MKNLTNIRIDKNVYNKIYGQFVSSLICLDNKEKSILFVNELFTESEKMMLAKRLAIIIMLKEGLSNRVISNSLNVSPATVTRASVALKRNSYNIIDDFFGDKETRRKIIKKILILRHELLPTRPRGASFEYLRNNKYPK
jgi:Trp operon repressor